MRVLVVGGGGREHALAWACARSPKVDEVICAPGNGGTARLGRNVAVAADDPKAVATVAKDADLVVVGPDAAMAAGVADACRAVGLPTFGPSAAAARIESSKQFAKQLMDRAEIKTARWRAGNTSSRSELLSFVSELSGRCVIKADGLALGKGVSVCGSIDEAEQAISACFDSQRFGAAGEVVLVEERLAGREVSVFALCDGKQARMLQPVCDYKRAYDGDDGPNTGGMGAYSPPFDLDAHALVKSAHDSVVVPTLAALTDAGTPFVGCLYVGLMLTADGPRVLEFNARFGDPETQVLMPMLGDDFVDWLEAGARGELPGGSPRIEHSAAITIVAATAGYPNSVQTGAEITLPAKVGDNTMVFHAGTALDGGVLRTAGGRVLAVTSCGEDLASCRSEAYSTLSAIKFDGMRFRTDIGAPIVEQSTTVSSS